MNFKKGLIWDRRGTNQSETGTNKKLLPKKEYLSFPRKEKMFPYKHIHFKLTIFYYECNSFLDLTISYKRLNLTL